MARQTRLKRAVTGGRKATRMGSAPRAKVSSPARSRVRASRAPASSSRSAGAGGVSAPSPSPAPETPQAPPRKPGYYEALAMYENGVRALQRHDYEGAANQFRTIIERYPEERELQERSQLYLRVCERETARRPPSPQTAQERVYAATVALNAGETATALDHLRRALSESPDSDHAQYIMSVALASTGSVREALEHLRRAIALNPENRALARQDPDLESVRGVAEFRELLEDSSGAWRSKARKRR